MQMSEKISTQLICLLGIVTLLALPVKKMTASFRKKIQKISKNHLITCQRIPEICSAICCI